MTSSQNQTALDPPFPIESPENTVTRRGRITSTFAYYLAFVILGLAAAVLGPTLPGLAEHTRTSIGQISYLFVLRSLGYLVGALLAGRLYDRVKGHPLMVLVILILAATMALVPLIPVLWVLAAALLVLGAAEGVLDVGGNTLLVWLHREKMGPYMNGLHFFFGLGAFLSPIIVAQVIARTGEIHWAFWILSLIMLPSAAWLARLSSPVPIMAGQSAPIRPALPVLIFMIALFYFLYVGAEVAYGGWVYTYAISLKLGSAVVAAYLTSAFWGAMTAGRLASIPIATRTSPWSVLLADLLLILASLGIILAFPASFTLLWVGTIGVGLGMASIFPTVLAVAERHMTITASVSSWFFVGSSLGGMTLPWVVGQLFEPVGPRAVMLAITVSITFAVLLYLAIIRYARKVTSKPN